MKYLPTPTQIVMAACAVTLSVPAFAQDAPKEPASKEAAAPAAPPVELKDPVAVVNGEKISKKDLEEAFDRAVRGAGMDPAVIPAEQKVAGYNRLLDDMIVDRLVKAEAKDIEVTDEDVAKEIATIKSQFPDEAAFKKQLEQSGQTDESVKDLIREGMKQNKWIESQIGDKANVSDEDAKKFYDENQAQFQQPETVKASHILFMVPEGASEEDAKKKEAAAEAALARAKKGEDFTALAKELSEEPGAKESGGDLGFFTKDQMVPEFADAAFGAETGSLTGPVKTQFGYHIIKVEEKKPAGTVSFEEVKPQLVGFLKNQKQQQAVGAVIDGLRKAAKIENNLPQPKPAPAAPAAGEAGAGN